MDQFIVELRLLSGTPFKRSDPLPMVLAVATAADYNARATTFTAHVVPAEKYAFKGIQQKVERPEEATPKGGFRSKVE